MSKMNYACDFSQSEMEKYFEWIIIYFNICFSAEIYSEILDETINYLTNSLIVLEKASWYTTSVSNKETTEVLSAVIITF